MKTITGSILGLILLFGCAVAQPQAAGDEAAIKALEEKWDAANVKGDAAMYSSLLADKFITTNAEGKVRSKAESVAMMKSGDVKFHASKVEDMKVYVYGDAAVVSGRWKGKVTEKGKLIETTERFTDTWIRQNGKWLCVASQGTTIK